MPNQDRKLATIQTIKDIRPIPDADANEVAKVMGWEVVIKKNEYKVGDKVVYFEIDSYLPREPRYEFLEKACLRNMPVLGEGLRLKTIKLRGQISQGLLMPLSAYPEHNLSKLEVGTDVTELLGVRLYEVIDSNGETVSKFHPVISKTDEIRAQREELNMLKNIINKSINNGLALPELVHQWIKLEFDVIEDYEVFENEQLNYIRSTQPDAKEIAQIYVNIYGEIDIPEEIMECVQQATEEGLSVEGFCMDCLYENCFDYDFDDEVNIWLNEMGRDYSDKVNIISNLWAQYTLSE